MSSPVSTATTSGLGDIDASFKYPRDFDKPTENHPYLVGPDDLDIIDYPDDESDDEPDRASWSAVRHLSKRLGETDEPSLDPHQDRQVVKFVEHGLNIKSQPCDEIDQTLVALVDDQIDAGGGHPCRGGLTRNQLLEQLRRPRFTEVPGHSGGQPGDINRRVIGVPDLAATEMDILAVTVPKYRKDPLMKFFRHHVNPSSSVECDMPSSGFITLSFQLHISYLVLRQHMTTRKDPRQRPNGEPLRGSWPVDCIPASKPGAHCYLHEAQRSIAVVIIDERVWTAYGTADTFFNEPNSKDSVAYRHNLGAKDGVRDHVTVDPISGRVYMLGTGDRDRLSDPCKYFLAVFESAIREVLSEYGPLITKMDEVVQNGYHPTKTTGQFKDYRTWNDDVLDHIRRIMTALSNWLDAWEDYQKEDPRHISGDIRYLPNIKKSIRTLEKHHSKLAGLKEELKRNHAKIKQQVNVEARDAQSNALKLACIVVFFSPLSQAMNLFNMHGLPFDLSTGSFGLSLVGIGCMWAVVCWLVMGGTAAMDPVVRFWRVYVRRWVVATWEIVVSLVWRGKLGEVFELEGSRPVEGSTTALQDPPEAVARVQRAATWPMFSTRRRNERQDDPGYTV